MQYEKLIPDILRRFELHADKGEEAEIIEDIKKGVEFTGTNLWLLILAIFIASIGLNVNSTAVIIGAMLISPLMGPIMGIGLGAGINDFELIKRSIKNLSIAALFSIFTSFLYFAISPLSEAQSELLARTTPTIWDVLIAFIGGTAGIIGMTRREKGNVVPGVAIATALMPPLCTSGYGLANGNLYFFFGAFYLFLINGIFISVSSFLIIRFLKFSPILYVDKTVELKMKKIILLSVFLVTLPSIYLAYNIVLKSIFESNSLNFIKKEIQTNGSIVIYKNIDYPARTIEVTVLGGKIEDSYVKEITNKLKYYNLEAVELKINYDLAASDSTFSSLRTKLFEELVKKTEETIEIKNKRILELESANNISSGDQLLVSVAKEISIQYPFSESLILHPVQRITTATQELEKLTVGVVKVSSMPSEKEKEKLIEWLKVRIKEENLQVYFVK